MKYCKWGILHKKGVNHTDTGQIWVFKAAVSLWGQPPGKKQKLFHQGHDKTALLSVASLSLHRCISHENILSDFYQKRSPTAERKWFAFQKTIFLLSVNSTKGGSFCEAISFSYSQWGEKKQLGEWVLLSSSGFKQVHGEATQQWFEMSSTFFLTVCFGSGCILGSCLPPEPQDNRWELIVRMTSCACFLKTQHVHMFTRTCDMFHATRLIMKSKLSWREDISQTAVIHFPPPEVKRTEKAPTMMNLHDVTFTNHVYAVTHNLIYIIYDSRAAACSVNCGRGVMSSFTWRL